jgi:hypothetical protein
MPNTQAIGVAFADPEFESVSVTGRLSSAGVSSGASSSPVAQSSSGSVNQFYVTASHASGDVRGIYSRVNFTGAGAGETLRAFSTVAAAQGAGQTTNGAHISLSVNSGGSISGAANAVRATLGVASGVTPGGTLASLNVDSDFPSSVTLPGSAAFIRASNSNTGAVANLLNLPAAMVAVLGGTSATPNRKIACVTDAGTTFFLMAVV